MKTFNVSFDPTANLEQILATLTNQGVVINHVFPNLNVLNVSAPDASKMLATGITFIEEEQTVTPLTQSTGWQQRRITSRTLPMRTDVTSVYKGEGTTLYLVDSGVDTTHPELSEATVVNTWSWDGAFTPALHGTTLATLMVGKTLGISPKATLKVINIPFGTSIPVTTLLMALEAIHTDHLLTPTVIKVVNCSWIIAKSALLDTKIGELQTAGLIVVAAAGNQGLAADNYSPAGLNTVLGVAASDAYDRVIAWATGSSSNWGPEVNITAPGIAVDVIAADGTAGTESGTSVAAAITSAAVCHFIQRNQTRTTAHTAAQVQQELLDNAIVDALFRNETIYGTTPNQLLLTVVPQLSDAWGVPDAHIPVQKGTTATLVIPFVDPILNVSLVNFAYGSSVEYKVPAWATYAAGVLTVSPPSDAVTGRYPIILTGTGTNAEFKLVVRALVYTTAVTELNGVTAEQYLNPENLFVTVMPQFCSTSGQCTVGPFPCCISSRCAQCKT